MKGLVDLSMAKGKMFDRIVLEVSVTDDSMVLSTNSFLNPILLTYLQCTGVAEPKAVVDTFKEAEADGMPLMERVISFPPPCPL